MSNAIRGAKIFSSGTWNEQEFTNQDLDGIVQAFNDAGKAGRIPLKFGHSDAPDGQPFREGMPALGWVAKLWRKGADLMADFTDIPTVVFDAVKAGLYRFTSIELLKNAEYAGKRFPYLLDAVALLGAEPPAVDGVSDLQKLALSRASFTFAEVLSFTADRAPTISKFTPGDRSSMTPEEIQAAIADGVAKATRVNKEAADAAAAELAKFKREAQEKLDANAAEALKLKNDNEKLKLQVETQAAAVKADKIKLQRDTAKSILEAGVRAKKISPAQRLLHTKVLKIDDDEAVLTLDMKDVEGLAGLSQEEATKVMGAGKSAFSRDKSKGGNDDSAHSEGEEDEHVAFQEEFTQAVRDRAKETGKTTFACMADVVRLNPKLGKRFLKDSFETGDAA